jgi:hypothetical protein
MVEKDPNIPYYKHKEKGDRIIRRKSLIVGGLMVEVHVECNSEIQRLRGTEEPYCPRCKIFNVPYKKVRHSLGIKLLEDR